MQAIILNKKGNYIETLNGTYKDGVFSYKTNQIDLWIAKVGGKIEEIEFDYDLLVPVGKGLCAFYQWDGKNLTQLSLKSPHESSVVVDYIKNFKISQYAQDSILKKPESILQVLQWIMIFVLIAAIIGLYFVASNAYANFNKALLPIQQEVTQNGQIENFMANEILRNSQEQNATLHYMENLTAYLQSGGR